MENEQNMNEQECTKSTKTFEICSSKKSLKKSSYKSATKTLRICQMHLILFLSPKRVHFSKTTDA